MKEKTKAAEEERLKCNPCNIPSGDFIVTSVLDNFNGTKITLDDENTVVEILFNGGASLLRLSNESMRMQTWGNVQKKYDDGNYFVGHFFYVVNNSSLSKWAEEENYSVFEANEFTHYCIVTSDDFIDILSTFEPTITMYPVHN
jgi:hypothetical protein